MSPGSSSRPSAANRPGRALRRQALAGAAGDSSTAVSEAPEDVESQTAPVDIPSSAVDPRALKFRSALSQIPDLEHGEASDPEETAFEPPPTSTSQQVIDLDAIPARPRLPNTAEVDLAERLKSVPDGTPLPAVRTGLARPSRARRSFEEEIPADRSGQVGGAAAPDHTDDPDVAPDGGAPSEEAFYGGPDVEVDDTQGVDAGGDLAVATPRSDRSSDPEAPSDSSNRTGRPASRVRRTVTSTPPPPPWWRRLTFGVALAVLVAAVPVLFVAGYRTVTRSTDGQLNTSSLTRGDPGYEELVNSTPTAVLTQLDAEGTPIGHTLLSLSSTGGGGSVVFIPLDTELTQPAFGVSTLRTVVTMNSRPPAEVRDRVVPQIARLLNVGIDETFELDDAGWAQMLAPVGAIDIQNPDAVEVLGTTVDAGPVTLEPDQVGGYLGAERWGETQLNQFVRHEEVWRSWLDRVAGAGEEVVPGEADRGLGMFIRTLAAGPVTYLTLPGDFGEDGIYRIDEAAVRELVVDHVPVPDPADPGSRITVRVLNGVEPSAPSTDLIRRIVANRGSISVVGNASSFEVEVTDIVYSDPEMEPTAVYMGAALDIDGEVRLEPTSGDEGDLTIILGRDLHEPDGGP